MTIMEEINELFPLQISKTNLVCKFQVDKEYCIKMDSGAKFSPKTKHIALKYHHNVWKSITYQQMNNWPIS